MPQLWHPRVIEQTTPPLPGSQPPPPRHSTLAGTAGRWRSGSPAMASLA